MAPQMDGFVLEHAGRTLVWARRSVADGERARGRTAVIDIAKTADDMAEASDQASANCDFASLAGMTAWLYHWLTPP
jgi:hypothetical protein